MLIGIDMAVGAMVDDGMAGGAGAVA